MKYGLIGERLGHSFSKIIHGHLADYDYELCEVPREDVDEFFSKADFTAINVTIPYKETVIPNLYYIDDMAKDIGAVNTVVNRDGKLYGYNTDFYGLKSLAEHAGISLTGRKVAILGTGGTSKTARAVAKALGSTEIITVSRKSGEGTVDYEQLYREHGDVEVIINTTPVGMYPSVGVAAVDLTRFSNLCGVLDAVYNPIRSRLVSDAIRLGIPAEGGLYMLVAQAVRASEIFLGTSYPDGECERIYKLLASGKENIVLIGMPACGKSSVGRIIAERMGRRLTDTDEEIVKACGVSIPEIFAREGEAGFRDKESAAVRECAMESGLIISTGGGAILREENVRALKENGRLYFIDRPLELLMPTEDRPLSRDRDAITNRYNERYPIYTSVCDVHIDGSGTVDEVAEKIIGEFMK